MIADLFQVRIFKYIHSRGVCHQDFKIDNLMVDKDHAFIIGKKKDL